MIMKKVLLSFVVFLLTIVSCMAQKHLTFKGIPIEGSMSSFCQKLVAKGFAKVQGSDKTTMFTGDFTGRNATIGVTATDDGQNVFAVVVLFDTSKEWNVLVNTYDYYKGLYTRKYGEPKVFVEENPAGLDTNTSKMLQLYQGTVKWGSGWVVEGGEIEITIEKATEIYEGMVVIRYRDSQNVEQKILKDLEEI